MQMVTLALASMSFSCVENFYVTNEEENRPYCAQYSFNYDGFVL